jgi:hypothetical protein
VLQESIYSGYVKHHGSKFLTVSFLNGLIKYMYGLISGRENDIGVLNLRGLNAHLISLQPQIAAARECGKKVLYFTLYGDSIVPMLECIAHSHRPPFSGELDD